jgi:hypothetical protein
MCQKVVIATSCSKVIFMLGVSNNFIHIEDPQTNGVGARGSVVG